jgi:hypothetical protein
VTDLLTIVALAQCHGGHSPVARLVVLNAERGYSNILACRNATEESVGQADAVNRSPRGGVTVTVL